MGPTGTVLAIDVSSAMLDVASNKAAATGVVNVEFRQVDAEQIDLPRASFDLIFCGSELVFMSDIPGALRRWFQLLKPAGSIGFDMPAKPFGISEGV